MRTKLGSVKSGSLQNVSQRISGCWRMWWLEGQKSQIWRMLRPGTDDSDTPEQLDSKERSSYTISSAISATIRRTSVHVVLDATSPNQSENQLAKIPLPSRTMSWMSFIPIHGVLRLLKRTADIGIMSHSPTVVQDIQ
jgi:hypothetical protein